MKFLFFLVQVIHQKQAIQVAGQLKVVFLWYHVEFFISFILIFCFLYRYTLEKVVQDRVHHQIGVQLLKVVNIDILIKKNMMIIIKKIRIHVDMKDQEMTIIGVVILHHQQMILQHVMIVVQKLHRLRLLKFVRHHHQ